MRVMSRTCRIIISFSYAMIVDFLSFLLLCFRLLCLFSSCIFFQKTVPFLSLYLLGYYKFPVIIKFTMFVLANGKYVFYWLIMSCFYWLVGLFATLFLHMSCSCYLEGLFAPLFLYMSHTPHILENPALITTLIHSFSSYYTHSLYIINHPTYFDLYIYTVVPII